MKAVILGSGGHAKVVASVAQACGLEILGFFDDDSSRIGQEILGFPVLDSVEAGMKLGHSVLIGIGSNRVRQVLMKAWPSAQFPSLVHPAAIVHPSVTIQDGSFVFAGAVVQPDVQIGRGVVLNTSSSVDHDCRVGDFSSVGPGARLSGAVVLGEGSFIGVGASIIQGIRVGHWTTIGAGAVVIRDAEADSIYIGAPARKLEKNRESAKGDFSS